MKLVLSTTKKERFARDLRAKILGSTVSIDRRANDWGIHFTSGFIITVGTFWRLIGPSSVCVTCEDDGHQFGLPSPIDVEVVTNKLLSNKAVEAVEIDFERGDLSITFEGSLTLEVITTSSGYESWQMWEADELFAVGRNGWWR